jgi:serine/threonine-protein kinase
MTGGQQRYRVLQELGQGGTAKVFLAVVRGPQNFSKLVVLKAPRRNEDGSLGEGADFLEEARLAARLNHPNIVETYEVFEFQGTPIIVMQYLEGQALSAISSRGRDRLSLTAYLHIMADTLGGLHHSHELRGYDGRPLNVVHRDVSPQNVFITYDGLVKVLDFGIAKLVGISEETKTGIVKGKIGYMAPEQVLCNPVDRRTDLFAAGVMLWEAAAGERMYKGLSEAQILHRLISGETRPPSSVRPVDPEVERVIMKALSPNMDDRYATALDMQADIEALIPGGRSQIQRKLGSVVSEMFADEREARGQKIEQALSKAAPVLEQSDQGESTPLDFGDISLSVLTGSGQFATGGAYMQQTDHGFAEAPTQKDDRQHRRAEVLKFAIGAAVVLILGLVLVGLGWARRAEAPGTAASAVPSAAAMRTIRIRTSPPQAKLYLDDRFLGDSPFAGVMASDDAPHALRVVAPGHEDAIRTIRLDRDTDVEVALAPIPQAPAAPAAPVAPTAATEAVPKARQGAGTAQRPAQPAAAAQPATEKNCAVPYYVDSSGVRRFKQECL